MTEEELKAKFDYIQGMFNRCISHACQILIDSITVKSRYLNREQADELERQEYIHAVDELSQLYIRYSALNDIQNFYSVSDFFWESGFYEALKPDEKRKYLLFSPLSFDYSRYEQDWKIQCKLPPKTKRFCPLKTFNNAPLKSLDRWGYYYFRKRQEFSVGAPVMTEEIVENGNRETDETESVGNSSSTVLINYGTGMPIDLIYSFLKEDYETKGYDDALSNPDVSYKEMNKSMIRSNLEIKFRQVKLKYTDNLRNLDFHIKSRSEAGLVDLVKQLEMKKEMLLQHMEELNRMERDFQENVPYMTGMLLSYERGFLRGLGALSLEQIERRN